MDAPKKNLNVVIVGTGAISAVHADAIGKIGNLNLTACWNRPEEREKGETFADKYKIKYYPSLEGMLDSEKPDITVNCLAYGHRCLGLEKAAMNGSHLVLEKPMGISVEACKKMIGISERHHVKLAVSESSGFNGLNLSYQYLRGHFGKTIHVIDSNYRDYFSAHRNPWAFDPVEGFGGMILNVGVHRVSRLRIFAGAEEYSVSACTGKMDRSVEGDACMLIRYKNNACGIIMMCGYHNPGKANSNITRIVTEKGNVIPGDEIVFTHSDGTEEKFPVESRFADGEYTNFYSAFTESIISDAPSPYSGEMGMRDLAVIFAAFKSQQEKREVTIDEIICS